MSEPAARLGALLLASFATFSLVLPMRMFHFWDALPQPLRALLWFPYATSLSFGPLLFIFFAVFPTAYPAGQSDARSSHCSPACR